MKDERERQIRRILNKYECMGRAGEGERFRVHYQKDGASNEVGYVCGTIDREKNGDMIDELEELGFKVMYPMGLKPNLLANKKEDEKEELVNILIHNSQRTSALIVDRNEQHHTAELLNTIMSHYQWGLRLYAGYGLAGQGAKNATKEGRYRPLLDSRSEDNIFYRSDPRLIDEGMGFEERLESVGFDCKWADDRGARFKVKTDDNIKIQKVDQSSFKKAYYKAKTTIKDVFNKIKNLKQRDKQETVKGTEEIER